MATNDKVQQDLRERPIGEVASELAGDVSLLVRKELQLAKAEMREQAARMVGGIALIGGGVVVALCALGALTAFLVLLFSLFLDAWLAALVVGIVLGAVAALLALAGRESLREAGAPVPDQTIESVKEDVEWVKERASSGRR